jgi:cytochrome c553
MSLGWFPRAQAWQHAYALLVLIHCDADYPRLAAAARRCRAEIADSEAPLGEERVTELSRAADLCEQAAKMVADAGAVSDDQARRRLLAVCHHQTMMITLGSAIPAVAESSTEELRRALEEINEA